jgi:FSR family fosmidomycin resistance protein-like MFS transporter
MRAKTRDRSSDGRPGGPTPAPAAGAAASRLGFHAGVVLAVGGAHFFHDVFTALLPPLLPLIIEKLGLSLLLAGSLVVLSQIVSLFNPLLGSLVDRHRLHRLLVITAPGVTGTLMCFVGVAPSYAVLVVLLLTVGCSMAALHVAGPVLVREFSGASIGRGLSYFMVGGELARTVGPLVAIQLVAFLGLEGMWKIAPAAAASSLVLWWRLAGMPRTRPPGRPSPLPDVWRRMRRVILAVAGVLMARAFLVGGLTTFLPTYLYGDGSTFWFANLSLAVLELSGAAGALASGTLSDRWGRRRVLLVILVLSPLLMLAFLSVGGAMRLLLLVPLGVVTFSTTPVLMAVMIENSGADPAAANGTFMMMSFAVRALIILAVGALGDALGLHQSYMLCAGLAAVGIPFVLLLPGREPDSAPSRCDG